MPNGIFSGLKGDSEFFNQKGLVALLGSPSKTAGTLKHTYKTFYLIYIDEDGKPILMNQKEMLEGLTLNKDKSRHVPAEIDRADMDAIQPLADAVKAWIKAQIELKKESEGGEKEKVAGFAAKDLLEQIRTGQKKGKDALKGKMNLHKTFDPNNIDLICWEIIQTS